MAAATMLNSGYQTFIAIIDVLFFNVATFLPNLVKIGQKLKERHQFIKIQDGGNRHVKFRLKDAFRCDGCVVYQIATFLPNLVKIGKKIERTASRSQNSRWRQPPC